MTGFAPTHTLHITTRKGLPVPYTRTEDGEVKVPECYNGQTLIFTYLPREHPAPMYGTKVKTEPWYARHRKGYRQAA